MRNLLLGVILGLLTLFQPIPAYGVTEIPAKAEDDVYREAVIDGFIVDHPFSSSTTSESPKHNTTIQRPDTQHPTTSDDITKANGPVESSISYSAQEENGTENGTERSVVPSTETGVIMRNGGGMFLEIEGSGSGSGSGSASGSGLRSGPLDEDHRGHKSVNKTTAKPIGNESQPLTPKPRAAKELQQENTTGWPIILGFVVGVAATLMACIGVATRWNRSKYQVSQKATEAISRDQQRELETFLEREEPKVNGHAAEYTVIPLDEFPEEDVLP